MILAILLKAFVLFAFLIVCAAGNALASYLPDGWLKTTLLRNY